MNTLLYLDSERDYYLYNLLLSVQTIDAELTAQFLNYYIARQTQRNIETYIDLITRNLTVKASKKQCIIGPAVLADPHVLSKFYTTPYFIYNLIHYAILAKKKLALREYGIKIQGVYDTQIPSVTINALSINMDEKTVRIRAMIRTNTGKLPILKYGVYMCKGCGGAYSRYHEYNNYTLPQCAGRHCKRSHMCLESGKSTYMDVIKLDLQEVQANLATGEQPRTIVAFAEARHDLNLVPGQELEILAVVKKHNLDTKNTPFYQQYVEILDVNTIETEVDEADAESVLTDLKNDSSAFEARLLNLITPMAIPIEIKRAILLQLIGGTRKALSEVTFVRGDIHILIIGDPGQGKSQLLKNVAKISQGIFASGVSSSAVGLTAAVVKDSTIQGKWAVEAGAFVFADNKHLAIDEIDKVSESQITGIHEAMEQQSLSIAKAGIVMTLNTRCPVLAAGNPTNGQFIDEIPVHKQIGLIPTILNRFDLVYVLKQKTIDAETVSNTILDLHSKTPKKTHLGVFRTYLALTKKIKPVINKTVSRLISALYIKLKKRSNILVTARQLESIIRLVEARTKMRLDTVTDEADVQYAEQLVLFSLLNENVDTTYVETGISRRELQVKANIFAFLKTQQATYEQIISAHPQFTKDEISSALDKLIKKQYVYKPTHQTYKLL